MSIEVSIHLIDDLIAADPLRYGFLREYRDRAAQKRDTAKMTNTEVIEVRDLVRIDEDAELTEDDITYDEIYSRDVQAIGVVAYVSVGKAVVRFPRVVSTLPVEKLYLVDVDGLRAEMQEIIAENETQTALRQALREAATSETFPVDTLWDDIDTDNEDDFDDEEHIAPEKRAELDTLRARVAELKTALTPFADAAKDEDVLHASDSAGLWLHDRVSGEVSIFVNKKLDETDEPTWLEVRHVRAAHRAVYGTEANAHAGPPANE